MAQIVALLLEVVDAIIGDFINKMLDGMLTFIVKTFTSGYVSFLKDTTTLTSIPFIQAFISYGRLVATFLLVLIIVWKMISQYLLETMGEGDGVSPLAFMFNGVMALVVIYNAEFIINEIYRFGINLVTDITGLTGYDTLLSDTTHIHETFDGKFYENTGVVALSILIAIVLLLIIMIQMYIRKAELIYYHWIAPFTAVSTATYNRELWMTTVKGIVVLSVSQATQLIFIYLFFESFRVFPPSQAPFYAIGFAWIGLKSPQALKEFSHSTGVGGAMSGMGRMVSQRWMMKGLRK